MSWWPYAEAVLAGALAGLIGVQVVLRRLSFFTMALTHATFPGVVAAAILGINIYLGGALAGALVALGVAALSRSRGQNASAATGVVLSAGFALGVGLVATQNGFSRDLSSFLVGSILTVGPADLAVTACVLGVVALALLVFGRALTFAGFDSSGARAAGYRIGALDVILLLLIELVIVTIVPAVGTILALALIVAPAAAARMWSSRLSVVTGLAVAFGVLSGALGLVLSGLYDVAAGASITLVATAILLLSILATKLIPALAPDLAVARSDRSAAPHADRSAAPHADLAAAPRADRAVVSHGGSASAVAPDRAAPAGDQPAAAAPARAADRHVAGASDRRITAQRAGSSVPAGEAGPHQPAAADSAAPGLPDPGGSVPVPGSHSGRSDAPAAGGSPTGKVART